MRVLKPLAILALALAPLAAQPVVIQPSGSGKATETRTVPLAAGASLKVSNVNGAVRVEAWDRAEVQFTGEFKPSSEGEQVKVVLEPRAGGLEVRGEYPKHHGMGRYQGPQCEMTLMVPRQVLPDLDTVNGAVALTGTRGRAKVSTVNGDVQAKDLPESLEARTVNGGITVEGASGSLDLGTVNGSIHGRAHRGRASIKAGTVNGAITFEAAGLAGRLDASTTNGHIAFSAKGAEQVEVKKHRVKAVLQGGDQPIELSTVNGSITVE